GLNSPFVLYNMKDIYSDSLNSNLNLMFYNQI
ncbi:unnamed protein product, partial [marine sediment metagenome]